MSTQILHELKAEEVLKGSPILGQTLNLKETLKYKTSRLTFSFEDYFHILNAEIQGIERIELTPAISPGGAQSYLAELSTALQLITDKVESAHTKAIYFEGKLRSAAHLRDNLKATFSAWYLIAISEKLKMYDIKLPASTQKSLAESEFSRLVGEEDLNIDGIISAVEVMVIHLKEMKKIANEKYRLGTDQANTAIVSLPFNGVSESSQFSLLKQRWNMKTTGTTSDYDDEEVTPPPPEGIHKIISGKIVSVDDEEVEAADLQTKAKEWRTQVESIAEEVYKKSEEEDDFNTPMTIVEDSFAGTIKIQGTKVELVPQKKRTVTFDDEDEELETISVSNSPKKAVMDNKVEFIKPKNKAVSFDDDDDADFSAPPPSKPKTEGRTPAPPLAKSKKVSFEDEDSDTPF